MTTATFHMEGGRTSTKDVDFTPKGVHLLLESELVGETILSITFQGAGAEELRQAAETLPWPIHKTATLALHVGFAPPPLALTEPLYDPRNPDPQDLDLSWDGPVILRPSDGGKHE